MLRDVASVSRGCVNRFNQFTIGLDDIAVCIDALDPDVRVVTPEAFIQALSHFHPGAE